MDVSSSLPKSPRKSVRQSSPRKKPPSTPSKAPVLPAPEYISETKCTGCPLVIVFEDLEAFLPHVLQDFVAICRYLGILPRHIEIAYLFTERCTVWSPFGSHPQPTCALSSYCTHLWCGNFSQCNSSSPASWVLLTSLHGEVPVTSCNTVPQWAHWSGLLGSQSWKP